MKKETLHVKTKETTLRIQNTHIEAVRSKTIEKNTIRLFHKNKIGIAGTLGKVDWNTLERQAKANLSLGLKYPHALSEHTKDHRHYPLNRPLDDKALMETGETLLKWLRSDFPFFRFSQMISAQSVTKQMWNTESLDLFEATSLLNIGLLFKEEGSADLFNGFIAFSGRNFDLEKFKRFNHSLLSAFQTNAELPNKKTLPVFTLQPQALMQFLNKTLSAEPFASGSSLLSGRMHEQVFNEAITIEVNRDPAIHPVSFFDHEGATLKKDHTPLIEDGVLLRPFADKANAHKYDYDPTACASGDYDSLPNNAGHAPLRFKTDSASLNETLDGEPAILVLMSAGGDFTGTGHFAAPVQVSLLFDGQKLLGKLPEFTMKSHLFRMLGADYLGTFDADMFYFGDHAQIQGYTMTIEPH